jgi:hypothetical protein
MLCLCKTLGQNRLAARLLLVPSRRLGDGRRDARWCAEQQCGELADTICDSDGRNG